MIARNSALVGGGIMNILSSPSITNNTIVANRPSALYLESALMDYFGDVHDRADHEQHRLEERDPTCRRRRRPTSSRFASTIFRAAGRARAISTRILCFANPDADDYHLKSQAGRWDPATQDVGRGHGDQSVHRRRRPHRGPGRRAEPNGDRINLGAYGGTAQASKSPGL